MPGDEGWANVLPSWKALLPGAIQGLVSVAISFPMDTLKTYRQTNMGWPLIGRLVRRRPTILLRGIHIPMLVTIPERAVQYAVFEAYSSPGGAMIASLISCVPASIVATLANKEKVAAQLSGIVRLQESCSVSILPVGVAEANASRPICLRKTTFALELCRNALATTLFLSAYGRLREHHGCFVAASASTAFYWTVTYPLCTLKTLSMTEQTRLWDIVLRERWSLWRGIGTVYLRIIPTSYVGMQAYEWARVWCASPE